MITASYEPDKASLTYMLRDNQQSQEYRIAHS